MKKDVELSAREQGEYRLGAALFELAHDPEGNHERSGLAFEVSDALERFYGRAKHGGLLVPYSLAVQQQRAGLDTATATKGAELKFTEAATFIEALQNKSVVIRGGATVLENLKDNLAPGKQNGTATASWVSAENPLADVGDTNLTFATSPALSPKELIATTSYSKQLLALSFGSSAVDQIVRRDIAKKHGEAIDLAALNGSGAAGQPTGLIARVGPTNPVGTNGGALTWPLVCQFEETVAIANADLDIPSQVYVTTPEVRRKLRTTDRQTTSGWMIMDDGQQINDYNLFVTNQLPKTTAKGSGTNLHAFIFGLFSEIFVGFWDGGLEIVADAFRLKKQGMIELTSYQLADTNVRHAQSFAIATDVLPT
jgi:HK97 family phage major capsid protein